MPRSTSNLKLLQFISSLDTNGNSSLGPQSLFKCDLSDEDHISLIPSKSVVEVLDIRYSSSNAYACLLKDFLSSHQNFFGTGTCSVLSYTQYFLSEILVADTSQESITETLLILETVFADTCNALQINDTQNRIVDEVLNPKEAQEDNTSSIRLEESIDSAKLRTHAPVEDSCHDIDWFFTDTCDEDLAVTQMVDDIKATDLGHCKGILTQIGAGSIHDDLSVSTGETQNVGSSNRNDDSQSVCEFLEVQYRENDIYQNEYQSLFSKSPVYSDKWLAYGLQHCFQWEFELNSGPKYNYMNVDNRLGYDSSSPPSAASSQRCFPSPLSIASLSEPDISLPMNLAAIAAIALWGQGNSDRRTCGHRYCNKECGLFLSKKHTDSIQIGKSSDGGINREHLEYEYKKQGSASYHISTSTQERKKHFADEEDYHSFLDELSIDDLVVHTVSGMSAIHCCALAGSLVVTCSREVANKSMEIGYHSQLSDDEEKESMIQKDTKVGTNDKREGPPINSSHRCCNCNENGCRNSINNGNMTSLKTITFKAVAVVDTGWGTDGFDSGEGGEGVGASQQAHRLNHTFVRKSAVGSSTFKERADDLTSSSDDYSGPRDTDNQSEEKEMPPSLLDRESSSSLYLINVIALLKSLKVSVLLCTKSFCSQKLLDACLSASIAIFPLSSSELRRAAEICEAIIVGDILDLDNQSIGYNLSVNIIPLTSMTPSIIPSNTSDAPSSTKDEILVELFKQRSFNDENKDNDYSFIDTNGGEGKEECLPIGIVSVIMTSPTEGQTLALVDRFYRCLHRLRAVFQGGGIMPGAGIPELLCCLQLDREIDTRTAELLDLTSSRNTDTINANNIKFANNFTDKEHDPKSSIHQNQGQEVSDREFKSSFIDSDRERQVQQLHRIGVLQDIITLLRASQRSFFSYIRAVSMNNGASWIEAEQAIEVSTVHMKAAITSFQPTTSLIDHLRIKNSHEICELSLHPPIYIPTDSLIHPHAIPGNTTSSIKDSDNKQYPVLDVVGLKISSFKNAIAAIKMFLSAQTVVSN